MNTFLKMVSILMYCSILVLGAGCAPTLVLHSTPRIQTAANSYYDVQFEPLKEGNNFFVSFKLSITNKTRKDLIIDWNKTRYLFNNRAFGVFVFEGIQPENIKNSNIPPDVIPAGQSFSKIIAPYQLLARAPLASKSQNAGKISTGPIPSGQNGIALLITQNGQKIVEKLTVNITKNEAP